MIVIRLIAVLAFAGAALACWQQWVYRTAVVATAVRRIVKPIGAFFADGVRNGGFEAEDFLDPAHLQEGLALRSLVDALGRGQLARDCHALLCSYGEAWATTPPPVAWHDPAPSEGIWATHEDAAAKVRIERQLDAARRGVVQAEALLGEVELAERRWLPNRRREKAALRISAA